MSDPWLGRTFAGCTLEDRIAANSSAHLFRATREADGARVSVAVVHPSPHRELATPERVVATFGKLGTGLPPGLPAVWQATRVSDQLVLVMEPLRGETLETAVRRGPLSGPAVAQLASELSDVLAFLHSRGVIHGGLTPARVLMTSVGARLLETGVAPMGRSHIDDVRAFGSCLAVAAAGPQAMRHVGPIAVLHPMLPPWLAGLIDDCRLGGADGVPDDGLAVKARVSERLEPLLTRSVGGAPPTPPPVRSAVPIDVSPVLGREVFERPTDPGLTPPPPFNPPPPAAAPHLAAAAPAPRPSPEAAAPAPVKAPAAKSGFDAKEAVLGLAFGIGSGLVIFGVIYVLLSFLTGGFDAEETDATRAPEASADPAVVASAEDTGAGGAVAETWPIEVVNGGGQILHLACAWDGETMGDEVPLLNGESWSGEGATVGSTCWALEPASGEALWSWTAEAGADSDAGYRLEIPVIPKAESSPRRERSSDRAVPESQPAPPPRRAAPPPPKEPVEELVKLRIVPGAKRKKKQEGVGVRVDGRRVGNAPVTVDMLDPGGHRVEATWEGKSVSCVITVMSGSITVSVDPAAGSCAKQ